MAFPQPTAGLVIRYSYLWHREQLQGREEGRKDRPCAIIASIRTDEAGNDRVLVLPVTHTPPSHPSVAVEIPAKVKERLGLDAARSWIVLSEWNEFVWPGPDLRRLPGEDVASIAYGILPPGLFASVRNGFLELLKSRRAKSVRRT